MGEENNLKDVKPDYVKPSRPDIVHGDYSGESTPLYKPPVEQSTDDGEE
jgi:hypothetical protein